MENEPIPDDTDGLRDDDYIILPTTLCKDHPTEVAAIEAMAECFYQRYSACPAFYTGSLIEACQAAFRSTATEKPRPVLVYMHHGRSIFGNIFCENIFCWTKIIDYLLENYIVWPCDVTLGENRNRLTGILPDQVINSFDVNKYPKLIGIKRIAQAQQGDSLVFENQSELLLEGDVLVRNQVTSNRENVLDELTFFKKQCDENEQSLSYYLNMQTRLGNNAILHIVKYITLNDAVNAFTINILLLLREGETAVEICDPDNLFINTILSKLEAKQVVSLRLTANWYCTQQDLSRLNSFSGIRTMSLLNFPDIKLLHMYQDYFPHIKNLCLWYDNEVNFTLFHDLFRYLNPSIKRFEVHCPGYICPHSDSNQWDIEFFTNYRIEYFLFDLSHFPLSPTSDCTNQWPSCFLITIMDLIKYIPNIQYFQLITSIGSMRKLLDLNEWIRMTSYCSRLAKITLRVLGCVEADEEISQKRIEIRNTLCGPPQNTQFQVIFH
ncbi:unnamed protein product [Rotaria magnacalcarata]|uniref:UAS domain-containing protein n=1 Tax=Rotaria magnacalcarata TaxID=392030 RepID=A0A816RQB6_9BILA|nr:unnamed protein product [Rotaria magnacalcarata]CAF2072998.1 unnamed protein product [Rotaria magnacalcarata]CAF4202265.1 unnamed protein product [Rotaria magnacalcarata]